MNVILTGGTGYIGSAVLRALVTRGHAVTALVRSDASAAAVAEAGAHATIRDLAGIQGADALIHTASPGDATSADLDTAVVDAVEAAGIPVFVHTGGAWAYGSGSGLTEDSPRNAPALVAWRAAIEDRAIALSGTRTAVVEPGVVHGGGAGLTQLLADGQLVGDGTQHWPLVHADDVADLYVRALEDDAATGRYLAVSESLPVHAIAPAGATPETADAARERLGAAFADALLLDQRFAATRARDELGWQPQRTVLTPSA